MNKVKYIRMIFNLLWLLMLFNNKFGIIKADTYRKPNISLRIEYLKDDYYLIYKPEKNTDNIYKHSGLYKGMNLIYSLPYIEDTDTVYINEALSNVAIIKSSFVSSSDLKTSVIQLYRNGSLINNYNLNNFFITANEMLKTTAQYIWMDNVSFENDMVYIQTSNNRHIKLDINTGKMLIIPSILDFLLVILIFIVIVIICYLDRLLIKLIFKKIQKN